MAVPFCVLLEGQASSCTEPTARWQRLNAGGGGEISYRAAVKRRHPLARSPSVVRRANTMQKVSMAAWRQSILIGLHGGHACIEVRLRRRGAGHVQRLRGARRRVHTSWGFSEPSTQTAGCFTRNMFLDCMILLHLGPCSSAACVEAPSFVDRTCFAQSACAPRGRQLVSAPAGLLATHLPRPRGERSQWHRASASHFGSTPLRRRWQGQTTGAGGSFR